MDVDLAGVILLVAYASLVLELVVFHVPSEASTFQVFARDPADGSDPAHDALAFARTRARSVKVVVYLLPTAAGVLCFLVPPVAALFPGVRGVLLPIDELARMEVRLAGIATVVVGRIVTFSSVLQMRRRQAAGALQPDGLFRWSRNPGLVGMYAFYAGASLMTPCVVLFIGFVPYLWNMHRRVLMEESHLERSLGAPYAEYLAQVPRYVRLR